MSFCGKIIKNLSGKRDSDPRPQPWQGCALPTELFPQQINIFLKVKRRRLELPRHNCHYPLKVARLPIPPPLHYISNILNKLCPEQDSNLHVVKHTHLKRARLPIPPPGHTKRTLHIGIYSECLSGKRDLNSRPQPWQGCALPTELLPHSFLIVRSISLECGCKGSTFSRTSKTFPRFFFKKVDFFFNPCVKYSLPACIHAVFRAHLCLYAPLQEPDE